MMRRAGFLLLLSLCTAMPSLGDQDPHVKRGIASGSSYGAFDIDTINNHNGNLVLRIPLSELPVGPFLSQGLALRYNSKIYDYQRVQRGDALRRRALPERYSNAGFGWSLSLGRLVAPNWTAGRGWFYRAPDGAEHEFRGTDPANAVTDDGSFLRFKRYPSDTGLPATSRETSSATGPSINSIRAAI